MIKCTTVSEVHFKHVCSCVLNESRMCGNIVPLILHLTAMQRQVISITPQTLFFQLKGLPGTTEQGAKRAPGTLWTFKRRENFLPLPRIELILPVFPSVS
jgi:hypothetical protein